MRIHLALKPFILIFWIEINILSHSGNLSWSWGLVELGKSTNEVCISNYKRVLLKYKVCYESQELLSLP